MKSSFSSEGGAKQSAHVIDLREATDEDLLRIVAERSITKGTPLDDLKDLLSYFRVQAAEAQGHTLQEALHVDRGFGDSSNHRKAYRKLSEEHPLIERAIRASSVKEIAYKVVSNAQPNEPVSYSSIESQIADNEDVRVKDVVQHLKKLGCIQEINGAEHFTNAVLYVISHEFAGRKALSLRAQPMMLCPDFIIPKYEVPFIVDISLDRKRVKYLAEFINYGASKVQPLLCEMDEIEKDSLQERKLKPKHYSENFALISFFAECKSDELTSDWVSRILRTPSHPRHFPRVSYIYATPDRIRTFLEMHVLPYQAEILEASSVAVAEPIFNYRLAMYAKHLNH